MKAATLDKLLAARVRAIDLSGELVTFSPPGGPSMPVLATPTHEGVVLAEWVARHRDRVEPWLLEYGAILFRGFNVLSAEDFQVAARALGGGELLDYTERSSPRSRVVGKIFTSTDHPPDQRILFHNELAYAGSWPLRLCFGCLLPCQRGGETPIADSRRVLGRLSAATRRRFMEKGVLYVRYLGGGLGLHWRDVFQAETRQDVERYCADNELAYAWEGDCLRTRSVRPAVRRHPRTGEEVWFNHGYFFNSRSMPADLLERMLRIVGDNELPFETFYGDGVAIEPATIREIAQAYEEVGASFPWQRGDVLCIDNMLTAHARNPYEGDRKILVAMTNRWSS